MDADRERWQRLREGLEEVLPPRSDLDGVVRRARVLRVRRYAGGALAAVILAAGLLPGLRMLPLGKEDSSGVPASEGVAPAVDRIAFTRNGEIHLMNPDGTEVEVLLGDDPRDPVGLVKDLAWSPDGRRIAFAGEVSSPGDWQRNDIWVMNADGTDVRRLTDRPADERGPVFSPDGTHIAFVRRDHIVVIRADGTGSERLLRVDEWYSLWEGIAWSSDGEEVLFYGGHGPPDVPIGFYAVGIRDGRVRLLVEPHAPADPSEWGPIRPSQSVAWSPDGTKVSFWTPDAELSVMNIDGSGSAQLTDDIRPRGEVSSTTWSPDGTRIAFVGRAGGKSISIYGTDIYLIHVDGSRLTRLTDESSTYGAVAWSPAT